MIWIAFCFLFNWHFGIVPTNYQALVIFFAQENVYLYSNYAAASSSDSLLYLPYSVIQLNI